MADHETEFGCGCGQVAFSATDAPLFRVLCHCTICQRFNRTDFADILVYRAADVHPPPDSAIEFKHYKRLFGVARGRCNSCDAPTIERFSAPLFPALIMVPTERAVDLSTPTPIGHLFYEHRRQDVQDDAPKHTGFFRSQLAFMRALRRQLRTGQPT
ncbi:MAG: GFA family protein [Pseudomonadota bacterium]